MATKHFRYASLCLTLIAACTCQLVAQEDADLPSPTFDEPIQVELTVDEPAVVGVPILSKIPYVSRLFKNVGVKPEVIRLPQPSFDLVDDSQWTEISVKPRALCGHVHCNDHVHHAHACSTCDAQCKHDCKSHHHVHQCAATCDTKCKVSTCSDKCKVAACDTQCKTAQCKIAACGTICKGATCKVVANVKAKCDDCQCCGSCGCSKPATTQHVKLHEHLIRVITENAQLKARAEAQCEIAEQKERFLHEMFEAKMEVVKLQARIQANDPIARRYPVPGHVCTSTRPNSRSNAPKWTRVRAIEGGERRLASTPCGTGASDAPSCNCAATLNIQAK